MKSAKSIARFAGLLYLLQIPLGVFGIIYVPKLLAVEGNLEKTCSNILAHEQTFRLSMVSAVLCALITVATAYYLYKLFKPVNQTYSKMIVVLTLLVAPITILNELNNAAVLLLLKSSDINVGFTTAQSQGLVSFFLKMHQYGLQFVNIFFGLWLFPMAVLVIRSGYVPRVIGYFLLVTCLGYLLDFSIFFLAPHCKLVFSEYTWMGEVMMVTWLLIKGVRQNEFDKRYGTTAAF